MLPIAERPPRQSLREGPSTVLCVAVAACTVVMRPCSTPKLSLSTLTSGARQFVVQDALETNCVPRTYFSRLTPVTNIGVSSLEGADMTTYLAPASMCPCESSLVRKRPVLSTTYSTPAAPQLISRGSFSAVTRILRPLTTSMPSCTSTVPSKRPCTESYLSIYAIYSTSMRSLIATTSRSSRFSEARKTSRPIRPKPLIPTFVMRVILYF